MPRQFLTTSGADEVSCFSLFELSPISLNDWLSVVNTDRNDLVTVSSKTSRDCKEIDINGGKFSGVTKPSASSKLKE